MARSLLQWVVYVLLGISFCQGDIYYEDGETDSISRWLAKRAPNGVNMYLPTTAVEDSKCQNALQAMQVALQNGSLWAGRIVDSWAKVPDGMYVGNWNLEGVYDECLKASSPDGAVKGKYCRVYVVQNQTEETKAQRDGSCSDRRLPCADQDPRLPILFPSPFSLAPFKTYSTCIPDACAAEELEESVSVALENSALYVNRIECHTLDEPTEYTAGDIAFITLLSFFLFLMVAASVLDIFIEFTKNKTIAKGGLRFLLPFSIYTNLGKMIQLNTKKSSENITCLHGIRVLSMIWVIYGHQHSASAYFCANLLLMFPKTSGFLYQIISNAFFSVDSFFFLSGFLVSYVLLREMKRTGKFNVPMFYLHRLIRLLPPIAIATGLFATVARYFSSGPLGAYWDTTRNGCIRHWWRDLLFVNNFFIDISDPEAAADCIGQAWYLAVDTQLYIVAPLIILPLHYFKVAGRVWLYFLTIVSIVVPAAITYAYDLNPTLLMLNMGNMEFFKKVYVTPWCRAGPWLVGVWLGYIFHVQGQKKFIMKRWQVVCGWTLSTVVAFLLVMGLWSYNVAPAKAEADIVTQVAYGGLSRPAWGAVLAWIIFACHHGYGGPVDGILSHPSWQPLSRITYSTYLVAMQLQILMSLASKSPYYFTAFTMIIQTVAGVIVSCLVGALVSLTAEAPIIGLEKLLLRRPGHGGHEGGSRSKGQDNEAFQKEMEELSGDKVKGDKSEDLYELVDDAEADKVTKF